MTDPGAAAGGNRAGMLPRGQPWAVAPSRAVPTLARMDLTAVGLRRALGAIREQNVPLVLLGAALVAIGLARRLDRIGDDPVFAQRLKPGESLTVVLATPDGD